jgi:hypothetical protein
MSEEKQKEIKLVNISFSGALKFWLAFLVIQVIAGIILFFIGAVVFAVFIKPMLQDIINQFPQAPAAFLAIIS